jgi:hypothetical protein
MVIPKEFRLGRKRYTVSLLEKMYRGVYGRCYPSAGCITVATTFRGTPRTPKHMAETFWHEVTHCVLHDMGHPLWKDEKFVTAFSQRLNQVVHTAKGF